MLTVDRAKLLVDAIRRMGSDARDPRDAAHEAHHALQSGLKKKWTRDNIHNSLIQYAKRIEGRGRSHISFLVGCELDARAVEWSVCKLLGVDYDVKSWALTMWMETMHNGIALPDGDWCEKAISIRMRRSDIAHATNRVLEIADARAKEVY